MAGFIVQVEIDADIYHGWEYFFNQLNGWWPKDYFTSDKTKRFIIETFVGGKLYEDHGEGCGLIWGDVIGVDYPNSLQVRGNLTQEFGGPSLTFEKFVFISKNGGSLITYSVDFINDVGEKTINTLKSGWEALLKDHFKNYCTNRK